MGETLKRLGASEVTQATGYSVYTAGTSTAAVVSSISVCNLSDYSRTYTLAHVDYADVFHATSGVTQMDYFAYEQTIDAKSTIVFQLGIAMEAADSIYAASSGATLAVIAWGSEIV